MAVDIPTTAGLTESEIQSVEKQLGCDLPIDYRAFLSKHDGAEPASNIVEMNGQQSGVRSFEPALTLASLRTEIDGFPSHGVPIADDDCGNYFWLDPTTGQIFFWDHEIEDQGPAIAADFSAFLDTMQPFDPASVQLKPGQLISSWINPDFLASLPDSMRRKPS